MHACMSQLYAGGNGQSLAFPTLPASLLGPGILLVPVCERLGSSTPSGTAALRLPLRQETGLMPSLTYVV